MAEKIERFGGSFALAKKVMQLENDYDREVFNGDLRRVQRIDRADGVLIAEFDSREVEFPFGELDALVPAYATTIHKSQGSEYPAVVITIATQHYAMLARNLLYTAVTRGKRLVVIVGQRKALAIAVSYSRTRATVDQAQGMIIAALIDWSSGWLTRIRPLFAVV